MLAKNNTRLALLLSQAIPGDAGRPSNPSELAKTFIMQGFEIFAEYDNADLRLPLR